jgi:hypothetical protein
VGVNLLLYYKNIELFSRKYKREFTSSGQYTVPAAAVKRYGQEFYCFYWGIFLLIKNGLVNSSVTRKLNQYFFNSSFISRRCWFGNAY